MKAESLHRDFSRALEQLRVALEVPADSDLIKAGCIQYFEFCFELAWKTIKDEGGDQGIECLSPKACLKIAFQQGWIDEEAVWLEMLQARNRMAHTYNAAQALEVYGRLKDFFRVLSELKKKLG